MNHRCSDFRDRLGPYLDGELNDASAREIEQHLEGCPDCRSTLEELRLTDRLLREGLAGEEIDREQSESSLSETLKRLSGQDHQDGDPGGRDSGGSGSDGLERLKQEVALADERIKEE